MKIPAAGAVGHHRDDWLYEQQQCGGVVKSVSCKFIL
jgi:hypothetical protein